MNKKIIPAEASFFVPVEKVLFDHSKMRRSLETAAAENYPALSEDIMWDYTLFAFEKKQWALISITDRSTYGEECIRHSSRPNSEYVLYSYGEPVGMTNDSGTSYFGTDILGSVRSVTDKYGTVQADYSYDAFGSPYLGNLDNGMSFGYTGKAYDAGTGLYDYGFRDYSPVSARFTTVDPIRDGSNWFSYVVNDPVNYCDPFGLDTSDSKSGNLSGRGFPSSTEGYNQLKSNLETLPHGFFSDDVFDNTYIGSPFDQKLIQRIANAKAIQEHNEFVTKFKNNTFDSLNPVNQLDLDKALGIKSDSSSTSSCKTAAIINGYAFSVEGGISGEKILNAFIDENGKIAAFLSTDGSPQDIQGVSKALAQELNLSQMLKIDNVKISPTLLADLSAGAIVQLERIDKDGLHTHYVFKKWDGLVDSMDPNRPNAKKYTECKYEILHWVDIQ